MRPPVTWLIADTHWYHAAIVDMGARPADHMERTVAAMRRVIMPQDVLIHLGDVIFYQHSALKPIMDSVAGRKVLVLGNHDNKSPNWYRNNGFDFVVETFALNGVLYTHRPCGQVPADHINIHGHLHQGTHRKYPDWYDRTVHRLLSLEDVGYQPVNQAAWLRGLRT